MKIKGRTTLVLCLLAFGGFAIYDHFNDIKKTEKKAQEARIMTLDFDQVDYLEVQLETQKVVSKRSADGWTLSEPWEDFGDSPFTEDFVKNMYPEQSLEVAATGEDINWSVYGLDKPAGQILIRTADGKENVFAVSEKKNFEGNTFLRRNKENRVLVVNPAWHERVTKPAIEFRDRRFLRHKIASVDSAVLKNKNGTLEIHRTNGVWSVLNAKDLKIDQNKIRSFLSAIADAKASEYPAEKKAGLKRLFTLDLLMDGKKWNAQVEQAADLGIYATVSEPKFFMKLEPGALDKLITMTVQDFKQDEAKKDDQQAITAEQKEQK